MSRSIASAAWRRVASSGRRTWSVTARPARVLEHGDVVRLDHAGHAQRRGGDALVRPLLGQGGGLDVHLHLARPSESRMACSTRSDRLVHLLEPLEPGDADDDVGEALAAGLAHAHRAHLARRPAHVAHDPLDDAGQARRRPVHQRVDVAAAQPDGGDEHDRRDEDRGQRVAAGHARRGRAPRPRAPPGCRRSREPKCHAFAISAALRSRRPWRSDSVARTASTTSTNRMTTNDVRARVHGRAARAQPHDGLDGDPDRGAGQERRLGQRGQVLRLAVAVRDARGRAAARPRRRRRA